MNTSTGSSTWRWAALVIAFAGVCLAPSARARIAYNTIDPVAIVAEQGRQLVVTGPIICTSGERLQLQVTVTQRESGAIAEGQALVTCTGVDQQWEIRAATRGSQLFQEGPATAVAVGTTSSRGEVTDAHQWLVAITLVRER